MVEKNRNKISTVNYYVTGGTCMGRILACKVPFRRGNGVYHLSMDLNDWEVQGPRTMTDKQLMEAIALIRDEQIKALKDNFHAMGDPNVKLIEDPKWIFRIVDK